MKPNALVLALITTASVLPPSAHAADDFCSRLFIYAVNQICQLLPNGQTLCQPVGLAGPSESCDLPNPPKLVQVPLGPPSIQMPPFSALPNPFAAYPFAPMPYAPASAFPLPAGQAFALPNLTPPDYALPAQPLLPQPTSPTPTKQTAVVQPATTPPQAGQPAKPAPDQANNVTPAASAPDAVPLAKLMPETKPAVSPLADAEKPAPTVKVEPPPVKSIVESTAVVQADTATPAQQPVQAQVVKPEAAPLAIAPTLEKSVTAITTDPKPVETGTPPSTNTGVTPAAASQTPAAAAADTQSSTPATKVSAPASVDQPKPAPVLTAVSLPDPAEALHEDALAHFEFDSAELTPLGRAMLDDWIKQTAGDVPVRVTGHADRLGPEPYNDKLSLLRAESVKKYLIQKGVTAKRIGIIARGEKLPLISCAGDASPETKACLAPNRRAEINLLPGIRKAAKTAIKPTKSKPVR